MSGKIKNSKDLNQLRKDLDILDIAILDLVFKRFEIVKKIFTFKKQANLEYKDKKREEKLWDTYWSLWESNTTYLTKADWPCFSKVLKILLDQSFLQASKFITRNKK